MVDKELFTKTLFNDANLLAYYRLEKGKITTDSSGNGKTLTISGSVPAVAGKFGYGADFNNNLSNGLGGVNGIILNQSKVTFSCWVKPKKNNNIRFLMVQGTGDTANGCIKLYFYNTEIFFGVKNLTGTNGTFGVSATADVGFSVDVWMHLVGTYDGTNIRLYYNGSQVATNTTSGNVGANEEFKIGRLSSSFYPSNDIIDDVAIFNRALTSTEVYKLYKGTLPSRFLNFIPFFMT